MKTKQNKTFWFTILTFVSIHILLYKNQTHTRFFVFEIMFVTTKSVDKNTNF